MQTKKFVLVVLLGIILGLGLWWFTQPKEVAADDTAVTTPTKFLVTKVDTAPAQANRVEMPKAAAVGAKAGTDDSQTQAASLALAQAQLKGTVQDIAHLMREKGAFAVELAYLPPDELAHMSPERIQAQKILEAKMAEDSKDPARREASAQKYDYLATLTPTLSAAGDKATYYGTMPGTEAAKDGSPQKIAIFIKVNGKWYWKDDWGDE